MFSLFNLFFRYGLINQNYVDKKLRWRIKSDIHVLIQALSPEGLVTELANDEKIDKNALLKFMTGVNEKFAEFIATNLDEYHLFNPKQDIAMNDQIQEVVDENRKIFLTLKFYGLFPHISKYEFLFSLAKLLDDCIGAIDAYAAL